jgi:hypothetical protein
MQDLALLEMRQQSCFDKRRWLVHKTQDLALLEMQPAILLRQAYSTGFRDGSELVGFGYLKPLVGRSDLDSLPVRHQILVL